MKNNKVLSLLILSTLIRFQLSNAIAETTHWPIPDWETADNSNLMSSVQCEKFKDFATQSDDFKTDALLIAKDGLIQFEFYDSLNNKTHPHALWSITKTLTATLLGIAERDGRINLEQKLYEYYPKINSDENYKKISIKNLFYLDEGLVWNESIKDVSVNPVIGMLFGKGHKNMADYVAKSKTIKEGPTYKWNYSTGVPTLTMGVLKKVYGNDDYEEMPWRNLFNPLGIKSAVFERDNSGTFIGGAGAFATVRDLAKIGHLYLNDGLWNGEVILSPEWIKKMLTPSPGYISPGTVITDISKKGVYGGSIWLNQKVKEGFGKPYPHSPEDMYLAVGFKGQLIIVLPTQKMVIVRTGYDIEFQSKIDELVSRALSCFHDPKYPVGKTIPPSHTKKIGLGKLIKNVKNSIEANIIQASIAKTICSCHLVSGMDIKSCLKRNNFTFSKMLTKLNVKKETNHNGKIEIQVRLARFARIFKLDFKNSAMAYYDPGQAEYGCTLK